MDPALFVWLSLSSWATDEQLPKLNEHAMNLMIEKVFKSERSRDASRREALEYFRKTRARAEQDIRELESYIEQGTDSKYDKYDLDIARLALKAQRELVTDIKQLERRLWEQQPGGIEAPAPRKKH